MFFNISIPISEFKQRAMQWASKFQTLCLLDSNQNTQYRQTSFEWELAADSVRELVGTAPALPALREFVETQKAHLVGFISYDIKNELENLVSEHSDEIGLPSLYFFEPRYRIRCSNVQLSQIEIWSQAELPEQILEQILAQTATQIPQIKAPMGQEHPVRSRFTPSEYLQTVQAIRQHIIDGDVYELNFCQEFFVQNIDIQGLELFEILNTIAQTPFTSYFRYRDIEVLCASPERYLRKVGNQILSQPIKGTRRRGKNEQEDAAIRQQLLDSEKDRAENVMIVDLVRNDFARVCEAGTVRVPELCAIYAFPSVFQSVSTITGILKSDKTWWDALTASFPMGSMTGAPKIATMQLIEQYEKTKRGLYSGAIGYITPEQDMDFNVVIRSFLYNRTKKYLSFQVGGAIVYDSDPQEEYEECQTKIKPLLAALEALKAAKTANIY